MTSASTTQPAAVLPLAPAPRHHPDDGAPCPSRQRRPSLAVRSRAEGPQPGGNQNPDAPSSALRFAPGQQVFGPGSGIGVIYIVRAGCIRLYKTLPDGRSINLGLLGPNTVFTQEDGHDGLTSGTAAEALLDSTLLIVAEDNLQAVIAKSPELVAPLVQGMTRRLTEVQTLVEHLLARDVSLRLAATLLALSDAAGAPSDDGLTNIALHISRQELADMIGANRVTVTRQLIELERTGIVRTRCRATIAVDRDALRRRAQRLTSPGTSVAATGRERTHEAACGPLPDEAA